MLLLRKLVSHTYAAITYCSLLIVCNFLAEVKQTFNNKPWWFQIKTQISFYSRLPKNLKKWLKNLNQVKPILAIFRQRKLNQYNEIREEDISIIICDFLNNSYPYCQSSQTIMELETMEQQFQCDFCSRKIWFEIAFHGISRFWNISLWNLPLAIWDRIWIEKTFRGLSSRISKFQKSWIFFLFAITVQCVT